MPVITGCSPPGARFSLKQVATYLASFRVLLGGMGLAATTLEGLSRKERREAALAAAACRAARAAARRSPLSLLPIPADRAAAGDPAGGALGWAGRGDVLASTRLGTAGSACGALQLRRPLRALSGSAGPGAAPADDAHFHVPHSHSGAPPLAWGGPPRPRASRIVRKDPAGWLGGPMARSRLH